MALIEIDPLTGDTETYDYDHSTGNLTFTKSRNVDALLDANVASYNDSGQSWRGQNNDLWRVASVDLVVLQGWLNQFNSVRPQDAKVRSIYVDDNPEWERYVLLRLNSLDFRKLKTAPVRIG